MKEIVIFQNIKEIAFSVTYGVRFEKSDILRQYNDKCIMYSDSLQYHIIISET